MNIKKIFKEESKLKILALINSIEEYQKIYNHAWKNMNQEFWLKK